MQKFLMVVGAIVGVVIVVVFIGKKKNAGEKIETKLVQNASIQNFMMNPNPKSIDDLLPQELQTDPWGEKYNYKNKFGRYFLWSAGPDKNFSNLYYGNDDMLILERGTVSMDQKEDEIISVMNVEGSALLAEILLNCKNNKLEEAARRWAGSNGYIIAGEFDLSKKFKELKWSN